MGAGLERTISVLSAIVAGILVATLADRKAFAAFKSMDEAVAYNWKLTAWRAFQGAVIGFGSAIGVGFM